MSTIDGPKKPGSKFGANQPHLFDRQLPTSMEAERNTLGSILVLPEVCDDVSLILHPDDFYDGAHRTLYTHIKEMYEGGERIDMTLLVERLKRQGDYENIGGAGFLAEITQSVPTAANVVYYANLVRDKAVLRGLIHTGTEIVRDAYEETQPSREMLNQAEERIFRIRARRAPSSEVSELHDVLMEAFEQLDARAKGGASGLPTGYTDLDKLTGGLHPSELVIIAARPSMGKTALAANIAEYTAVEESQPTLFVSLEMSRLELVHRMMCSLCEISGETFRSGFLSADDHKKLIDVSATLGKSPLFIDDSPSRTVTEIGATARRLKRRQGSLGLIVVDYLQLIQPDNSSDPRQ